MGQVRLRAVRKSYGTTEIIKGIDLDVEDGEFMVFVGPSGCGKSTTLRMIAGLEEISAGDLFIDGQRVNEVRPAERGAAMVFQSYALYPHMTVAQNMGFALKMAGVARAQRDQQVRKVAETLRISDLLDRLPKDLSGGQRQRVAIGRAIVRRPKVFLFDEPLSNLDASLRVSMRIELSRLHKEIGGTMIYVTHDQVEAMTLGDRIAIFNNGKIEQLGKPMQLYQQPENAFVASFLGASRINLIERPGPSASREHGELWKMLAANAPAEVLSIGVRPEHLQIGRGDHGVSAQVELVEHLGDSAMVHMRIDGTPLLLTAKMASQQEPLLAGQFVRLAVDTALVLQFDQASRLLKR
jgi:multiple sugar transport system ATP-binding protein